MIKFCIVGGLLLLLEPGISNLIGIQILPGPISNMLKLGGIGMETCGIIACLMRFLDYISPEDDGD